MSAIGTVTVSTLYEYRTPDGRVQPLWHTRLATDAERDAILRTERGGLSYDEWRMKQEREG